MIQFEFYRKRGGNLLCGSRLRSYWNVTGHIPVSTSIVQAIAIFGISAGWASCAEGKHMKSIDTTVHDLVQDFRRTPRIERTAIERIFGTQLQPTTATNSFQTYRSKPFANGPLKIALELREATPGSDATVGSLLIIEVLEGCASVDAVRARYAPWTLLGYPRGEAADEATSWTHAEAWGDLAFGYRERTPKCIRSISFLMRDPA